MSRRMKQEKGRREKADDKLNIAFLLPPLAARPNPLPQISPAKTTENQRRLRKEGVKGIIGREGAVVVREKGDSKVMGRNRIRAG